ncbi:hypothetical protein BST27_09530 [Mycobacterium intermedium]|uniref:DUF732 domain-containing protein n=2 Tax=Mycobacterium TaxID=1763 RepID=A0A1E3SGT5_MYCIE|nr:MULTISPECIES: DUF732 domain-containing protein [Mycobacterium]MCV6964558.1 DUF732 domain-containing protein [Mycobacterium intermedium]MCV6978442.1 DUF732 domain-containing protein [Mycobacterium bourgelatii]ODR01367.1 hypothetical protein BHQ20_09315 [Mycobacterium intermedium]OPE52535.1 hypothetical protein BV508_01865 [Mycobacterium intermedium]ORB07498.1 hypothetical protein BST27_09530 [Mycobacterium intermedium]
MFNRRFAASLAGTTLTAATLGLAALGFAGSAGATTTTDDAFLAEIQADGITPPSAARAISEAHAVCKALDAGQSPSEVYAGVAERTGLSAKGSKTFAVDAAKAYCPQYVTST